MTISIARGKSIYAYKIEPDEPCQIWFRLNQHRKNWKRYGPPFASAQSATNALFELERPESKEVDE